MLEIFKNIPGAEKRMMQAFIVDGALEIVIGAILLSITGSSFLFFLGLSLFMFGWIHFFIYKYDEKMKIREEWLQGHLNKVKTKRFKE